MGSASDMAILARILDAHGDQLREEIFRELPAPMREVEAEVVLSNETRELSVQVLFHGTYLELRPLDLEDLCQRFPAAAASPFEARTEGFRC